MPREIEIPQYSIHKDKIMLHHETRGCLIVDGACIVGGKISTGTVVGNDKMGYFWEAWDFGSSDVIYDTYDKAKKGLIEYFWLLKDREDK